ncbi:prepilin-type N-terminal cleavage/methylation domain-containing protein [Pseudomonas sp. Leaf129]|uniref:pilin n=1 Tax=Pseudomonas sp. Leaf129 TaxID=1736268 RepID=UPI0012E823CA
MPIRERQGSGQGRGKSHGFTIIEMMIVVAIMGVLVALTLPMLSNYLLKVKAGRLLAELEGPKLIVAESWQSGGELCPKSLLSSITCNSESGALQNTAALGGTDIVVKLTPTSSGGVVLWSCEITPHEAAPKACL